MLISFYAYYHHRNHQIQIIRLEHVSNHVVYVYVDFFVDFVFVLFFAFGHYHLQLLYHYSIQLIRMKKHLNLSIVQVQHRSVI